MIFIFSDSFGGLDFTLSYLVESGSFANGVGFDGEVEFLAQHWQSLLVTGQIGFVYTRRNLIHIDRMLECGLAWINI